MEKLTLIQNELKVPKGNTNNFGKYKYRSAEDILEAVKPILLKHKVTVMLTDDVVQVGDKNYLKASAILFFSEGEQFEVNGYAEMSDHKGMSSEQATGTASSYARKYALNGLFLTDETEADPDNGGKQAPPVKKVKPKFTDANFKKAKDANATLEQIKGMYDIDELTSANYLKFIKDETKK